MVAIPSDEQGLPASWFARLTPGESVWSAWLGIVGGVAGVQVAFYLADRLDSHLGPAASTLVVWLVRWSVLILVLPLLGLTARASLLGYQAERRAGRMWVRAAGWGAAVVGGISVAYLFLTTLAELRYGVRP